MHDPRRRRFCALPRRAALAALVALGLAGGATAETAAARSVAAPTGDAGVAQADRGPVTNLPLPRFVSLKAAQGNARRGPSLGHRIDWVFVRRGMPLEVTGEYGHWRRVRDREGAGGWVHYSLLSGVRSVIVSAPSVHLRAKPAPGAPVAARAEGGVVARLGPCDADWCRVSAGGHRGWVEKADLWGVGADEVRD